MTDFSNIDPNFRVEPAPDVDGLVYRDALDPAFSLSGVTFEQGCYRRLPLPLPARSAKKRNCSTPTLPAAVWPFLPTASASPCG